MKKQIDMMNGNLVTGMLRFAFPLVVSGILQVFYGIADTFVLCRFDDPLSTGAVGSAGGIIGCVVNVFIGMALGVNILAARFYGAGDMDAVKRYGENSIVLGGVFGLVVCFLGQILARPLMEIIGVAPEIRAKTIIYIRIYMYGVPFSSLYNFLAAFLRGIGDTKSPTRSLIISGAVNVVLNVVFVKFFKLSVAGVALATAISMFVSFAVTLWAYLKSPVGSRLTGIRFNKTVCRSIIAMGLPAGLQNLLASVSNTFTTAAMNSFGAAAISGEMIEMQLECILITGITGINTAIVTFVGQNLGAKNFGRLDKIFNTGFVMEVAYCLIATAVCYPLRYWFVNLFAEGNAEVAMYALIKMDFIIIPFVTFAFENAPASMLRGVGGTFQAMLIAAFGCVFRVVWILFLLPQYRTVGCLFISYPIVWTLCGVIYYITYIIKKKQMLKNAVELSVA
ncbi:MAG: MATE family efflux transporter [Clostridia bacterium]|nr:MATE family efflux transporter [Clostridia bacterium]